VFDAMPDALIHAMFESARAVLSPAGKLCVCCLTYGGTPLSSSLTDGWVGVYRCSPKSMGGCRPLELDLLLGSTGRWDIRHCRIVTQMALSSLVVVASPTPAPSPRPAVAVAVAVAVGVGVGEAQAAAGGGATGGVAGTRCGSGATRPAGAGAGACAGAGAGVGASGAGGSIHGAAQDLPVEAKRDSFS